MEDVNMLQRSGSTFDKGGVIGKRKKFVIIGVVAVIVLASVIGLAVGVSQAKKDKHHDKAPAPTPTPTSSAPVVDTPSTTPGATVDTPAVSKAQSESMQRIDTQEAVGEKITPEILTEFLDRVREAANTFKVFTGGNMPEQPLTSHSLLIYIYEMDVKSIWDALVAYVQEQKDPKDLSLPDLIQLATDVKTMFSVEGLQAWGKAQATLHHKKAKVTRTLAQIAKAVDPALVEADDNPKDTSGSITVPTIRNDGTGRKLLGSHEAVDEHAEGGGFSQEHGAPCSDIDQEYQDVMRSFPKATRKLQENKPKKKPCLAVIPIVFHVLQYRDPTTKKLYPSSASWGQAAARIARRLNVSFSNPELSKEFKKPARDVRLRFTVGEVRADATKHRYLEVPYETWAACGTRDFTSTMQNLAEKNNADVTLYPNVYICGDRNRGNPSGYAWIPYSDADAARKWDHIFLYHDAASISGLNRKEAFWGGAWTLAHELGHFFGLSHTQYDAAVECTDGDGFTDTEPTLSSQDQAYYPALTNICETWRLSPNKWPTNKPWVASAAFNKLPLSSMSSCPPTKTIDPVFNVMSYIPDACMSHFTAEQVQYMRYVVKTYRKRMYKKWRVCPK